jgi:hypothetical protein
MKAFTERFALTAETPSAAPTLSPLPIANLQGDLTESELDEYFDEDVKRNTVARGPHPPSSSMPPFSVIVPRTPRASPLQHLPSSDQNTILPEIEEEQSVSSSESSEPLLHESASFVAQREDPPALADTAAQENHARSQDTGGATAQNKPRVDMSTQTSQVKSAEPPPFSVQVGEHRWMGNTDVSPLHVWNAPVPQSNGPFKPLYVWPSHDCYRFAAEGAIRQPREHAGLQGAKEPTTSAPEYPSTQKGIKESVTSSDDLWQRQQQLERLKAIRRKTSRAYGLA